MTEKLRRFEAAFVAWTAEPIEEVRASIKLYNCSQSLQHTQSNVENMLRAFHDRREAIPAPIEQWYDGMTWTIGNELRRLRRMVQTGRHQVATRDLLHRVQVLKELWDSYCSAIDK